MDEEGMGQGKQEAGQGPPLSEMDFAKAIVAALNRIASAIESNAQATEMLARATAGEFDQQDDPGDREVGLNGRPLK